MFFEWVHPQTVSRAVHSTGWLPGHGVNQLSRRELRTWRCRWRDELGFRTTTGCVNKPLEEFIASVIFAHSERAVRFSGKVRETVDVIVSEGGENKRPSYGFTTVEIHDAILNETVWRGGGGQ